MNRNKKFLSGKDVFSYNSIQSPNFIHKPILLIGNIDNLNDEEIKNVIAKIRKWWQKEVLIIFLYNMDENKHEPISITDIPEEAYTNSDVIISLYRPEYYKIDTWKDGTSTKNQIKFEIIKNEGNSFSKGRLQYDLQCKRVKSLSNDFLSKWYGKFKKSLENNTSEE